MYHLDDTLQDSTANLNHGTNSGSLDAPGRVADGQWFDGVDDYVDLGSAATVDNLFAGGERFRRGSDPQAGVKAVMVGFSTRPSTTSPTAGGGSNSTVRTSHCGSSKAIRVPLAGRGTHPAAQPNFALATRRPGL